MFNFTKVLLLSSLINTVPVAPTTSDPIYKELSQDINFDSNAYKIKKDVKKHDEFKGLMLYEHPEQDLILYVHNVTAYKILNPNDCRITMAVNDDTYNHYNLNYLGNTNDYKFYKFKVSNYLINPSINERTYKISEFELRQELIYDGQNAIGVKKSSIYHSSSINQEYKYSLSGYTLSNLTTLSLDVMSSYYRVPGSTTSVPFEGVAQNDIFYIYFLMPNNYGDLIEIDIDRNETYLHYTYSGLTEGLNVNHANDSNKTTYVRKTISNQDKTILNENNSFFWNPSNWFVGGSKGVNLKNLQRFSLNDLSKINDKNNNYCLDEATKSQLTNRLNNPLDNAFKDPYVIRYSIKEFYKNTSTYTGTLGEILYSTEIKKFSMKDIDVITCSFSKDGETYTLPVVSNTNNQNVGNSIIPNNEKIKRLIQVIIGLVLLLLTFPFIPYIAKFVLWLLMLPIKFINKIIKMIKK